MNAHLTPRTLAAVVFGLVVALVAPGCNDGRDADGDGRLSVWASDAPYPTDLITAAQLTVLSIEAHSSGQGGFVRIDALPAPVTFDLLLLQNGRVRLLVDQVKLPAGNLTQLRLVIDAARVTIIDGRVLDLRVPSAARRGLVLNVAPPARIAPGRLTELLLDIDLAGSFVPRGNPSRSGDPGAFDDPAEIIDVELSPVIRVVTLGTEAEIGGTIRDGLGTPDTADDLPLAGATVRASQAGAVVTTSFSDAAGSYLLTGLHAGDLTVEVEKAGYVAASKGVTLETGTLAPLDLTLDPRLP